MRDQRLHGGIEAVAFPQLDGEAFGEAARADAGRIEFLQFAEHGFDLGDGCAQLLGDGGEVAAQVAGLVHHVDQIAADHARDRRGDGERQLLGQMIGQRHLGRDEGFQIVVVACGCAGAGPFRVGRRRRLGRSLLVGAVVGEDVFQFGAEALLHGAAAGLQLLAVPVGGAATLVITALAAFAEAFGLGRGGRPVLVVGPLQQRVALQLAFHIGGQIEAGELQQLDGLHQLRRHHQRLGLAKLQSLRQSHSGFPAGNWSDSCLLFLITGSAARWYAIPHCGNAQNLCGDNRWITPRQVPRA